MSTENAERAKPKRRPFRPLQLSVRAWIALVALVSVVIGVFYTQSRLTPENIGELRKVASVRHDSAWEIEWSPKRDRMAVVDWEKPVSIWDPTTLEERETIGEGKKIIHFAFSGSEDLVAYCENTSTAVIVDRARNRTLALAGTNDQPRMAFSPDSKHLATGGYGTFATVWNVSDGSVAFKLVVGPAAGGLTPEYSPDGRWIAVGNRNSTTHIFDAASGKPVAKLARESSQGLRFHPSGHTLAIAYVDGSIALWGIPGGELLHERKTSAEELYDVDWSPDGRLLASSGRLAKITIWDPRNLTVLREIDAPEWVIRIKFRPDGRSLHYVGGGDTNKDPRFVEILSAEGPLFTLLNRPRR
jgi:WD40 repeat protein